MGNVKNTIFFSSQLVKLENYICNKAKVAFNTLKYHFSLWDWDKKRYHTSALCHKIIEKWVIKTTADYINYFHVNLTRSLIIIIHIHNKEESVKINYFHLKEFVQGALKTL